MEFGRFVTGFGQAMFFAGWMWVFYIAVEPYVRRRWPQVLISWTRLLAGRVRDPLVGRDILMGALFGVVFLLLQGVKNLLPGWLESARSTPSWFPFEMLLGGRHLIASLLSPFFVWIPFFRLFLLFVLRAALRKQAVAVVVFLLLWTVLGALRVPSGAHGTGLSAYVMLEALGTAVWLVLLIRFGLLAATVAFFFSNVLGRFPLTLDLSTWYVGATLTAMLTAVAVAAYGCHTALAGRPLFKDELLEG